MFPIVASAEELIKTASASLILISNRYKREDVQREKTIKNRVEL